MAWVRSGYCCRCGQCCVGDPFNDEERPRAAVVPGHCPLYEIKDGAGFCTGHAASAPGREHPYYLAACSTWPDHPDLIVGKSACTYKFAWVGD
jgi:hypothetical protein